VSMLPWEDLLPEWAIKDMRWRHRAIGLLYAMTAAPGLAFTGVFGRESNDTEQGYDFCENPRMSITKLLGPTYLTTGKVIREDLETVLVLQDTTELDLSTQKAMQGLGEIGNPKNRGVFLHTGFAVTPARLPVGLVSALTWVRNPDDHGKATTRNSRRFEEKESFKWWATIQNAERVINCPGKAVHLGDRESDIFEVLSRCVASRYRGLFRAAQDRKLLDAPHSRLWAEAESWPVVGSRTIDVPERPAHDGVPARAARTAKLALRFGPVTIAEPGNARDGRVSVWAVLAREVDPPSATDVVEWLLLSTDPLATPEDAWTRIDWYRCRWLIEEFHKCMKTTCKIEERQFATRGRFEICLALVMLVSVRVLFMRNIARVEPDAPAREVFSQEEETVLRAAFEQGGRTRLPPDLNVRCVVRMIAMLGGFLARKGDGEPGFQTLARGDAKLAMLLQRYRLAQGLPCHLNPLLYENELAPAVYRRWRKDLSSLH